MSKQNKQDLLDVELSSSDSEMHMDNNAKDVFVINSEGSPPSIIMISFN